MNKKKVRRIGIVVMLGLIAIGVAYSQYPRTQFIDRKNTGLSNRAAEYLAKRSDDESWQTVRFDEGKKQEGNILGGKAVSVGNCFTLTIPVPVKIIKNKDKCFSVFVADNPRGNIRAYEQKTEYSNINDVSDLNMRRLYKDKYKEREFKNNGRTIYVFRTIDPLLYDTVAFYLINKRLIIISMQFPTNENLDGVMDKMLATLEVM